MTTRFRVHLAAAAVVLIIAIWLSTGTMAPYAATLQYPLVLEPCHYLANVDHEQFEAPLRMLRSEDPSTWMFSVVLRRILFPALALPLVSVFGFLVGGVLTSIVIHVVAVLGFAIFVDRRFGETAATTSLWLLATYPGITYWAGLPYSYAVIVPGSLACMMLLYRIHEARSLRDAAVSALLLGVVCVGYDLLPFFGVAAVLLLLYRRQFLWTLGACVVMVIPSAVVAALLVEPNLDTYAVIVRAYLHPRDLALWRRYLVELPAVFAANFFYSNFVILPLLFCGALVVALRRRLAILQPPEVALLIAGAALFLFNNAAPPYSGWQFRGSWIARLYQPLFPAFLLAIARVSERLTGDRLWRATVMAGVAFNASIAFGPVMMNPLAGHIYQRFYRHSPATAMLVNLRRFGRRPLGVCRTTHEWDGIPDPNTEFNRPPYMFRYPPGGDDAGQ